MASLHGSWIQQSHSGYFFVWGEAWRSIGEIASTGEPTELPIHPFVLGKEALRSQLESHQLLRVKVPALTAAAPTESHVREVAEQWQAQAIALPTQLSPQGEPQFPILAQKLHAESIDRSAIALHPWQVEGFRLAPQDAAAFLQAVPLSLPTQDSYISGDLRFWSHVYRWSLDLIAHCKFLPSLLCQEQQQAIACWQPLLDRAIDRVRLREFAQLMPDSCRAYGEASPAPDPQALLLSFLNHILDAQLRTWADNNLPLVSDPTLKRWLQALSEAEGNFEAPPMALSRLENALSLWTLPVQDYLGTQTLEKLGQNQFRTCFSLQPPTENQDDWLLRFGLQSMDEAEIFIDAQTIWQHPVEQMVYQGRTLYQPQETLLKGLGIAARLYPPVAESLEQARPVGCELNPIQVYEFIRGSAWLLLDNGFGVVLPPGLAPGTQEKRLGIKLRASAPKKRQRLGLQSLLPLQWELAVGEHSLSPQEFERLLAQQSPIVEVNGEWIALQPTDVRAAQTLLKSSGEQMRLSVADAVRLGTGQTQVIEKLPVVNFEASGALRELITSLTDNKSLAPIKPPAGLRGELRTYQARGVSWLAFLERWGLGACLADDMGLGKCIHPESRVFVNGNFQTAEEIWQAYAGITTFDGEGFWARPTRQLQVNAISQQGQIVRANIRQLYRQQVREPLRKITLANGSSIIVTQRHKLLSDRGWTNQLQVGDSVGVPQQLLGQDQAEDLDPVSQEMQHLDSSVDAPEVGTIQTLAVKASQTLLEPVVSYCPIQSIEAIDYEGWVYDFEVEQHHNFVANHIFCHNTIQTIAFLLHLKEAGQLEKPSLLICPTSVLGNWEREIRRFAPDLSTLVHYGDKRTQGKQFAKQIQDRDLAITSYAIAYRDVKTLQGISWRGVILDEAQNIKNPQVKQSKAVRSLDSEFRIALTGTPVENRLSELWSILDFLNPGYLGTQQFFQRRFATPIEKYGDRDTLQTLRSLVQPFILRRVKTDKEIIQDLPEKQELNVYCSLSREQAALYQQLVDKSLTQIEESQGIQRRGLILTLLMKLKQLCNHPALFLKENSLGSGDRSGKVMRLSAMLEELVSEGDRALIFTQFSEWGKLLKPYLEQHLNTEILFLYGATRRKQRQEMIDRFQNDPSGPPIFILSLKAGGTGLNLTRANHVFHIDRWWNPAIENQATDRAFRIGQKRNVLVHKFICTGTLEERIDDMIASKKQLAEQTVDAGEEWLTELDTNQLRNLLLLDRKAIVNEEE